MKPGGGTPLKIYKVRGVPGSLYFDFVQSFLWNFWEQGLGFNTFYVLTCFSTYKAAPINNFWAVPPLDFLEGTWPSSSKVWRCTRYAPLQDRQCHIVVNGRAGLANSPFGGFRSCRRQTFKFGKPAPFPNWHGQRQATVWFARVKVPGVDSEGDLLMFTCNSKLFEFLELTHDGCAVPEFIAVRAFVEDKVKAVQHLRSVMQHRRHVLQTPESARVAGR